MATHSKVLAWRISGTAGPGGLPSMGSHRVGHDWSDLAAVAAATCRNEKYEEALQYGERTWERRYKYCDLSVRVWPACHAPVEGRSGHHSWRHPVLKGNVKLCPRIPAICHRLSWQPFYLSLCFHPLFSPIYFPYALEGSYKTQIWSSIFHSILNSPFFLVDKKLNSFTDYAKSFIILPLPVHSASIFLILTPDFMIRQ